ncbi:hypothetical protein V495_02292 [Pseudogymnoascus sp. VKM F-4514 (FW-929)]|nr:hypothetical protein V495_02292 [Pseudogymnoascus sp. VKM F-4514 (FW-929)]KFY64129.1 hypothetical protein V497_01831 [Pseudogymnoascus sp. VKM F-4516 (FW-969)]
MRITNIVAAGLAVLGFTQACETDEDCSLNGICSRKPTKFFASKPKPGACRCDPGWFGDDCGRLDLAPAAPINGYNHTDVVDPTNFGAYGNASWGGQILQDPHDRKLFHLFASQFAHGCGLSGWRPSSYIMRAESRTGPQGPYHYAEAVTKPFRHNPSIIWSPADKKYLLYTIGADAPEAVKCQSLSNKQWPNNISVSSSDNIGGPWSPQKLILNSVDPQSTNPAPWPLWTRKNPTREIALAVEDMAIYQADKFDGEYKLKLTQKWNTTDYSPTWTEDSFLWRDKRGNWHGLVHWLIDLVEHDGQKYPRVGAHVFARELGGPWHFKLHEAYNSTVTFTDGSVRTLNRRERPKIFFSDDGELTPLYFTTGVTEMGQTGRSSTLIQPIGNKWKKFEKKLGF